MAYHDTEVENQGSGKLRNPADGTYLNEFRRHEGIDISYTKQLNDLDSPCNKVVPPLGLLYVGWNSPGEWFNLTVEAAEAGRYTADVLYTAQRDATISISANGEAAAPVPIASTFDAAETIPWRQWHHWNVVPRCLHASPYPRGSAFSRSASFRAETLIWLRFYFVQPRQRAQVPISRSSKLPCRKTGTGRE